MAHIDSNQHGLHVSHGIWHLHVVKVATNLTIDLPQDIRSLRHVEGSSVAAGNDLRGNLIHGTNFLDHFVVRLSVDDDDCNQRMLEAGLTILHHVVEQLLLHLCSIILSVKLDHSWILNINFEHAT